MVVLSFEDCRGVSHLLFLEDRVVKWIELKDVNEKREALSELVYVTVHLRSS